MFKPDRLNGLLFFSLAFLLVLALLPATGWIVRMPLWLAIPGAQLARVRSIHGLEYPWQRPGKPVSSDPADYLLALGQAVTTEYKLTKAQAAAVVRALESVDQRFPGHASIPSYEIEDWLRVGNLGSRADDWLLNAEQPPPTFRPCPADREQVDAVVKAAICGEQRDPENALYPLLRACALMGARRDAEAIEAIEIAGKKTKWNEYSLEDVDARVHLQERSQGHLSAFTVLEADATKLFPYDAAIAELARPTIYKAVLAEQRGHREEGVRICHALMHVSGLMRADSTNAFGTLTGNSVARMSYYRPGGADPVPKSANWSEEKRCRVNRYCSYLASFGHADEARWVRAQMDAAQQAEDIIRRAVSLPDGEPIEFVPAPLVWLAWFWLASVIALCNAIWLFAAVGMDHLRRTGARATFSSAWVVSTGLAIIVLWDYARVWAVLRSFNIAVPFSLTDVVSGRFVDLSCQYVPLVVMVSFFVPLILSASILVRALRQRIPLVRAFRDGFRGPGAWLGAACLVIYGLLVIATAAQEANVLQERNRMRVNEGRYYAEKFGAVWPGPPTDSGVTPPIAAWQH